MMSVPAMKPSPLTSTTSTVNAVLPSLTPVAVAMQTATPAKNNVSGNVEDLDSKTFAVNSWILAHARRTISNIITMVFLEGASSLVTAVAKAVGIDLVLSRSVRHCA